MTWLRECSEREEMGRWGEGKAWPDHVNLVGFLRHCEVCPEGSGRPLKDLSKGSVTSLTHLLWPFSHSLPQRHSQHKASAGLPTYLESSRAHLHCSRPHRLESVQAPPAWRDLTPYLTGQNRPQHPLACCTFPFYHRTTASYALFTYLYVSWLLTVYC